VTANVIEDDTGNSGIQGIQGLRMTFDRCD